jgi:hypothetical protein
LQTKKNSNDVTENEKNEYDTLTKELDDIGFYNVSIDSRYSRFLELTSRNPLFQKAILTKEEEDELERISKEVAAEILNESNKS